MYCMMVHDCGLYYNLRISPRISVLTFELMNACRLLYACLYDWSTDCGLHYDCYLLTCSVFMMIGFIEC
jgi:hypothetical protein